MADVAAVTSLLEQVTLVIKGYADIISAADKEFESLKDDVEELKAILKDTAYASSDEDKSVRSIKNKIREIVYEVEDAIDSWLTELKAKSRISRSIANLSFTRKVKSLREGQVKEMIEKAREMKSILLQAQGTSKEAEFHERREVQDPPIRQKAVVGLKDEKDKIIGYLMKAQVELDIISIVGMPGLGKTALAWEIFNDENIRYAFPIRIWVHISQTINARYTLLQIMEHFTSNIDDLDSMTNHDLSHAVHACLSQERFLLVMDDIWMKEHWDFLKAALPYRNGKGKVLITSREMAVSRHAQHITKPHMQRPLNPEESWELLQLEVFGRLGSCPEALQEIGKAIAGKCKGIPMIIVVLGGVLKDHYLSLKSDVLVKDKWKEVVANENLALEHDWQGIIKVVALSYHRLPEHLRDCFLYLGVFPADYVIQAWTLKQLWIAEGFIQPDGKQSLEKIAEDVLNELISRNLLIVHEMNAMQEVKVCRVQTVIRMFCTNEAGKQNLFKDVSLHEENISALKDLDHMDKVHRLCLHSDLNKVFSMKVRGSRVRSFFCFRKDAIELSPENASAILESFPNLRVLQAQSIIFKRFPPRLIKLNHLRYIVLCISELEILPDQISFLWNLQTIIIHTTSESLKMRASLWKMIRLRHLKTKAAIVLEKKFESGDQAGENLQTLNRLSPESVPEVSRRATKLKTLGVRGNLTPLFEDMPLGNLDHLEKLKLYHTAAPQNPLQHFPDSNRFPPNLKRLTLSKTFLEWKHMSTLANIPGLQVLKLKDHAFTGIQWEPTECSFKNLEFLLIVDSDLVLWKAVPNTFPCLRHLGLKNCLNLKEIPDSVLQRLENLEIKRVRKSAADSARKSGAQFKLTIGAGCDV